MANSWTQQDIPDLTGKVAIVTGANSGIGFETAKEFARKGAQTILASRSLDKTQVALDEILKELPDAPAEIMQLDLASLASVRSFVETFKARYDRLDLLVNNAGIMMVPYGVTEDGFERQFGTNHLGHFALTGLLLDLLLATPGSRVVNVSSGAHRMGSGTIEFDHLNAEKEYSPSGAYSQSKLANLLFTYELQRRFEAQDADVLAVAAHPGGTNTNLQDEISESWYIRPFVPLMRLMMQDASMGALPTIRAAVDPEAEGGEYYGPGGLMEMRGYPVLVSTSDAAKDPGLAKRLWQVSEELTDIRLGAIN